MQDYLGRFIFAEHHFLFVHLREGRNEPLWQRPTVEYCMLFGIGERKPIRDLNAFPMTTKSLLQLTLAPSPREKASTSSSVDIMLDVVRFLRRNGTRSCMRSGDAKNAKFESKRRCTQRQ